MLDALIRPVARARYDRVLSESLITPIDRPAASSGSRSALRVLLLGSGVTSGRGVATYGLALVGALQRRLRTALDRPVDVQLVRQHGLGIEYAAAIAEPHLGEHWDAYVLAFGVSDALQLVSPNAWSRSLSLLLSSIEDRRPSPFRAPVVVAGIPPLHSFAAHQGVLMPYFARHAERLDTATRQVVADHPEALFTALPAMPSTVARPFGSPDAYQLWADVLAERLVPTLRRRGRAVEDASGWEAASPEVDRVLATPSVRAGLAGVAQEAASRLDAEYAVVRLLDGQHVWGVADSLGSRARAVALEDTPCCLTLAQGFLEIADLSADDRTRRLATATLYNVGRYVGIALRDPRGEAVGTIAVFGGRAVSPDARSVLEALARRAQDLLRREHEDVAAPPAPPPPTVDERLPSVLPTPSESALPAMPKRLALIAAGSTRLLTEGVRLAATAQRRAAPVERITTVEGPHPIRILMTGGGYGIGYGVDTRDAALDGALARLLHRRTGRGVEVINRAAPDSTVANLRRSVLDEDLPSFDLVLWTPVFEEAAQSMRRVRWKRHLRDFTAHLLRSTTAGVVLMSFPDLVGHQPLAVLGRIRAGQINRALLAVARTSSRVVTAEPGPIAFGDIEHVQGADVYRSAGVHLIDGVMRALQAAGPRGPSLREEESAFAAV